MEFVVKAETTEALCDALRAIGQDPALYVREGARVVTVEGERVLIEEEG